MKLQCSSNPSWFGRVPPDLWMFKSSLTGRNAGSWFWNFCQNEIHSSQKICVGSGALPSRSQPWVCTACTLCSVVNAPKLSSWCCQAPKRVTTIRPRVWAFPAPSPQKGLTLLGQMDGALGFLVFLKYSCAFWSICLKDAQNIVTDAFKSCVYLIDMNQELYLSQNTVEEFSCRGPLMVRVR